MERIKGLAGDIIFVIERMVCQQLNSVGLCASICGA